MTPEEREDEQDLFDRWDGMYVAEAPRDEPPAGWLLGGEEHQKHHSGAAAVRGSAMPLRVVTHSR